MAASWAGPLSLESCAFCRVRIWFGAGAPMGTDWGLLKLGCSSPETFRPFGQTRQHLVLPSHFTEENVEAREGHVFLTAT